jgi:hypothetical protein
MISNWHISFGVFLRPKKRFFDSNHFSELQVVCGEQEEISGRFYSEILFFLSFYDFAGSYCSEI